MISNPGWIENISIENQGNRASSIRNLFYIHFIVSHNTGPQIFH